MKCPLLRMGDLAAWDKSTDYHDDCLKEECAWWIKDFGHCCILDAALCLNISNDHLVEIIDKMPHAGQVTN